jgi:hypothetical protein
MSRVAPIAYACGSGTAEKEIGMFFASGVAPVSPNPSHLLACISSFGQSVTNLVAEGIAASGVKVKGLQKRAMALVEEDLFTSLLEKAPLEEQTRMRSASHPRANYWLAPPVRCIEMCWLPPAEFDVTLRLRFGVATGNAGATCNRCHDEQDPLDNHGTHELACMCGENRIALHNAATDDILAFASRGGLNPSREPRPFAEDAQARLDISFLVGSEMALIDFAVTSHMRRCHMRAAAAESGGAATAYEAVKRSRYQPFLCRGQVLHPIIFDTMGAWGASAAKPLGIVAKAYARRSCLGPSAVHFLYAKLNSTVIRGVARLLLMNSNVGNDVGE